MEYAEHMLFLMLREGGQEDGKSAPLTANGQLHGQRGTGCRLGYFFGAGAELRAAEGMDAAFSHVFRQQGKDMGCLAVGREDISLGIEQ